MAHNPSAHTMGRSTVTAGESPTSKQTVEGGGEGPGRTSRACMKICGSSTSMSSRTGCRPRHHSRPTAKGRPQRRARAPAWPLTMIGQGLVYFFGNFTVLAGLICIYLTLSGGPRSAPAPGKPGAADRRGADVSTVEDSNPQDGNLHVKGLLENALQVQEKALLDMETQLTEVANDMSEIMALQQQLADNEAWALGQERQVEDAEKELQELRLNLEAFKQANGSCFPPPLQALQDTSGPVTTDEGYNVFQTEVISWDPRIIYFHNFLSPSEVKEMRGLVDEGIEAPRVRLESTGQTLQTVKERIANATQLNLEYGEDMYVIRYRKEGQYAPQTDSCGEHSTDPACKDFPAHGGDRFATFMVSLRTARDGGELIFPRAGMSSSSKQRRRSGSSPSLLTACREEHGLKVKLEDGDGLLLWNYHPNGTVDEQALYGACAVLEGESWYDVLIVSTALCYPEIHGMAAVVARIMTRWIRQAKYV
eukprot:scaffold2882_cov434-Prasinococcus_capsulatus_cf.AAC.1